MLSNRISDWLRNYILTSGLDSFVIGVSGGIDSAVTSIIAAKTGKRTIVLSMPIHQSKNQLKRARSHISFLKSEFLNVESFEIDLTETFEQFKSLFPEENALALANSRSRLRMITLYQVATMNKGLVVGTGNKVEDFGIGFFTKYGDGGVDISPIADLTKTEVRALARELGVSNEIVEAPPTDGLWDDNRTDEDQIGATYEELERAMQHEGDLSNLSMRELEVLGLFKRLNVQNKHKMIPPPIFKK